MRDSQASSRAPGPPSEGGFIHALRDHALFLVDVELADSGGQVLGLTQTEIEDRSGLSRPSVSGLIERFETILKAQNLPEASRWTIDPDAGVVVGVHIADEAHVGVSDLYGRIKEAPVPQQAEMTADETIDWAVDEIRTLLQGRPPTDVVGVGVSVAGPVDQKEGQIRAELASVGDNAIQSRWGDWQLMKVREHLRRRLGWDGVPFQVDNDANLTAIAEYVWGAGRPSGDRSLYANVVYLEWSRGIGAGLILEGQLYRGSGVAGEIGHTIVKADCADIASKVDGEVCERCGSSGCLEMVAGWDAIRRRVFASEDEAFRRDDLDEALRLAQSDSHTAEAFGDAAIQIGVVLGPVIHLLNPQLVVIGGDIGRRGYDVVKASLLRSLRRYTMRPALADVAIVPASLRRYPGLQGAVSLILRPPSGDPEALLSFLQRRAKQPTEGDPDDSASSAASATRRPKPRSSPK